MDRHSVQWSGPMPAVVTPFDAAGRVDEVAFTANVERLLAAGATGIVAMYEGNPIFLELPASTVLAVTKTDPGVKGDRVSGAMKPATLETGITVQVPLFVNPGDRIKVDTRTGEYLTRV